jgi:curved DNA-binding protein CbpA
MGPSDRPLRGHRAPNLIFLGSAQTQNSLREFLVPQFNRIEVLAHLLLTSIRRSMTNPTPSATGTLEKNPFLHLLVSALEQGSSGTLVIETPGGSRSALSLKGGIPTKFKTAEPVERLGPVLVQLGWIDVATGEKTYGEASSAGKLHGEYLIENELLRADVVSRGLRSQMLRKLQWACTLPQSSIYGLYEEQDFLARWAGEGTPISPLFAVWQLARSMAESPALAGLVGRFESQVLRIHPRAELDKFGFRAAERAVLDVLRAQPQTLSALLSLDVVPAAILQRATYVLALTRQFDLGAGSEPMGLGMGLENIQELLESRQARTSSPVAISAKPARPAETTTTSSPKPTMADSKVDLVELNNNQETAARRLALQNLSNSHEQLDYYQLLGISRDATTSRVQIAFLQLAKQFHPDRLGSELADMRDMSARIFSRLTDAQQMLSDPRRRAEYDRQLTRGTDELDEEQAHIQQIIQAATSFQKAEVLFKKRMLPAAEIEAMRAHENDPEQADYIALLAWIHASQPNSDPQLPQILDKLNEAVRMSPEREKIRFYRGQVLSRLGRHREALSDYRFVVSKNPYHIDSLREIRLWEMRRKGQQSSPPTARTRSVSPGPGGSRRTSDPQHPARTSSAPAPSKGKSQPPVTKGGMLSKFFKR